MENPVRIITLTVEHHDRRWRIVRDGHPISTLGTSQSAKARARQIAAALSKAGHSVEVIYCKKDGARTHVNRVRPPSARARKIPSLTM
jgi:hypothetical protein